MTRKKHGSKGPVERSIQAKARKEIDLRPLKESQPEIGVAFREWQKENRLVQARIKRSRSEQETGA